MKKKLIIFFMLFGSFLHSQITLIPDPYFEGYLVNVGIDTDGVVNGQVLTSDIADETQLAISGGNQMTDLTGIEDFESLEHLSIIQMDITEINLTQNFNLKFLSLSDTSLESLDITENINLISFFFEANYEVAIFYSPITFIDISNNLELTKLIINATDITEINLVNNINLNRIILLYMSELEEVNLKNGFNEEITFLEIKDNPNFQCLQVDNPTEVIAGVNPPYDNWTFNNNPLLVITDDCSLGVNDYLQTQISVYPNPTNNILNIAAQNGAIIHKVQIYDSLGRLVLEENNVSLPIEVSMLASGLLFIKIDTENGVFTKKVIKE